MNLFAAAVLTTLFHAKCVLDEDKHTLGLDQDVCAIGVTNSVTPGTQSRRSQICGEPKKETRFQLGASRRRATMLIAPHESVITKTGKDAL